MKEIPLTQGKVALVDDEDFDYINQWKWYCQKSHGLSFYAIRNSEGGIRMMHRLIMNASVNIYIDHKDMDGLNNCRDNLRFATLSQNQHNRGKLRNNTSGFKCVSYNKQKGKWEAYIEYNNKKYHLGLYEIIELAALAYNEAALKYHGEFARLNVIP